MVCMLNVDSKSFANLKPGNMLIAVAYRSERVLGLLDSRRKHWKRYRGEHGVKWSLDYMAGRATPAGRNISLGCGCGGCCWMVHWFTRWCLRSLKSGSRTAAVGPRNSRLESVPLQVLEAYPSGPGLGLLVGVGLRCGCWNWSRASNYSRRMS